MRARRLGQARQLQGLKLRPGMQVAGAADAAAQQVLMV